MNTLLNCQLMFSTILTVIRTHGELSRVFEPWPRLGVFFFPLGMCSKSEGGDRRRSLWQFHVLMFIHRNLSKECLCACHVCGPPACICALDLFVRMGVSLEIICCLSPSSKLMIVVLFVIWRPHSCQSKSRYCLQNNIRCCHVELCETNLCSL